MALEPFGNQPDEHEQRAEKEKSVDVAPEDLRNDQCRHGPSLVDMQGKDKNIKSEKEQAVKVRTYRETLLINYRYEIQNEDEHQLLVFVVA